MNFRKTSAAWGKNAGDEPEINFIPLIDVLLVVLIFFMASTTFTRFADLQINLPSATANKPEAKPQEIHVGISGDGRYAIDSVTANFVDAQAFAEQLKIASGGKNDAVVIIHADAAATHQAVVNVMESARLAGLVRIAFATQKPAS